MKSPAKNFSLFKKISFSAITILLLFTLAEAGLHVSGFSFHPHYSIYSENRWAIHGVRPDPSLPWSWIPIPGAMCYIDGKVDFRFNQLGYRGPLFKIENTPATLRIVCMGDSATMGWGVQDGEMYCAELQNILKNNCNKRIETINAGVFGYTSFQGRHQLKNRILRLHPQIITICYNWNDHADAIRIAKLSGKYAWKKGIPTSDKELYHPHRLWRVFQLVSKLRIYQLMQYGAFESFDLFGSKTNRRKQNIDAVVYRVPLSDYKANLEEMIWLARENRITPILLTQALDPKKAERPENEIHLKRQQRYNDAVREVAAKTNVLCIDPTEVLETNAKFFNSLSHPTRRGHHIIAKALANAICSGEL